jgi:short-subunit dehydrogenase
MSKPVALITGASSGIGRELAHVFAKNNHNLVISGRREARLEELGEELASAHGTHVVPIAADLATVKGASQLFSRVEDTSLPIDVLVNNAGTALTSQFKDMPRTKLVDIVNLNVRAVTELTALVMPQMIARKSGRILNVASVAGFRAVPGMSVYSASKSFVISFSESLSEELKDSGITVTALCPGLTKTEMVEDLEASAVPEFLMADPRTVAQEGYDACMLGEVIRVPGPMNQAMVAWLEVQPRWLVRMMSGFAARSAFMTQAFTGR